jgi:hypothetical protein
LTDRGDRVGPLRAGGDVRRDGLLDDAAVEVRVPDGEYNGLHLYLHPVHRQDLAVEGQRRGPGRVAPADLVVQQEGVEAGDKQPPPGAAVERTAGDAARGTLEHPFQHSSARGRQPIGGNPPAQGAGHAQPGPVQRPVVVRGELATARGAGLSPVDRRLPQPPGVRGDHLRSLGVAGGRAQRGGERRHRCVEPAPGQDLPGHRLALQSLLLHCQRCGAGGARGRRRHRRHDNCSDHRHQRRADSTA